MCWPHFFVTFELTDTEKRNCMQHWRRPSSGMLRCVALVRIDVSEEPSASIIRVTRIGELGTLLSVTRNLCMLRRNTKSYKFLQEPHGVTS
jgi:hypothetical protein